MLNTVAMIFGYFMFCSLVLFCIYILFITIRERVEEKKKEKNYMTKNLVESMDLLTDHVEECLDAVSDLRYRIDALEAYIQSTKNTESVMEDRKEVLTNERISDEHEGQDR